MSKTPAPAVAAAASTSTENADPRRTLRRAVVALATGGFAIGVAEFVIMGLLPEIARDLRVSIPQAGHAISAYALGVVIGAPVLAVLTARWPRRRLLIALMLLFAIGNVVSALAPDALAMNLLRFATGLPHGTYFGVAALVAASLAPPGRRAQAVGMLMLGLTGAVLVGVPVGTWLGQMFGWRVAFVFVGAIALTAAAMIRHGVPDIAADAGANPLRELGALARPQVWLTLGIGAIGFGGMFAVFSYIKPTLTEVSGLPIGVMPFALALFGLGMVLGNVLGARLADKSSTRAIAQLLLWSMFSLAAFSLAAPHGAWALAAVVLVGSVVALGPVLQIRLMDVAGDAQTLAAALNHSAFNIANAAGAWLGGLAIYAGWGYASTGWVGVALAVGGMGVFSLALLQAQPRIGVRSA